MTEKQKPIATEPSKDRRSFLKKTGGGICALATLSGISSASAKVNRDPDKIHKEATKTFERTGSAAEYIDHLQRNGFLIDSKSKKVRIASQQWSEDQGGTGIGTQSLDVGEFSGNVSLAQYGSEPDYIHATVMWKHHNVCDSFSSHYAEDPRDLAGMHWSSSDYSRIDDSEKVSQNTYIGGQYGDLAPNGLVAEYDDLIDYNENVNSGRTCDNSWIVGYLSTKLLKETPSDPPESRLVTADYYHFWDSVAINAISVSTSGIGFSTSNASKQWSYTLDEGEENATHYPSW